MSNKRESWTQHNYTKPTLKITTKNFLNLFVNLIILAIFFTINNLINFFRIL